LAGLLLATAASGQETAKPAGPCVRSDSGVTVAGVDQDTARCRELILMEQIVALVGKVTQLEAEVRLMKSKPAVVGEAR
jgi:hypothetical protein